MSDKGAPDTQFTHFDSAGNPHMVNVQDKSETDRVAIAEAVVVMNSSTREGIEQRAMKKGDVLAIAELAGIMGAKRTADLIPLCHPIPITNVTVESRWASEPKQAGMAELILTARVSATYRTGVEMEALTACTTAALTVYDMCKALDRTMSIERTRLLYKHGGKSGTFDRRDERLQEKSRG
ncbi:MAG: molybdenum cofactor biosynthesis protein C [Alicyclobacillus sp. RIFOXYA1_FULL_53_8]|nr:MAG: molybdenum cofactor biosynthesis protein C [Alicyclobacillus sp. RIFOXYA1_FULL_53_8]